MMSSFYNKEQLLVVFLTNGFRLNKYDSKFINNLAMLLAKNKYVTSNQAELFDKLLVKYKRQLNKNKVNVDAVIQLPWNTKLIESTKQYTEAFLTIDQNRIKLQVPFNKDFIKALRDYDHLQFILWNRADKCYYASYYTDLIKNIIKITQKFFVLNISEEINNQLVVVETYNDIKYWNPTLVKNNDNYYILASNQHLDEALHNIELNNDPITLMNIARFGVSVDKSLLPTRLHEFSADYNPNIDTKELHDLHMYCQLLNVNTLIFNYRVRRIREIKEIIDKFFTNTNINIHYDGTISSEFNSNKSFYIYYGSNAIALQPYYHNHIRKALKVIKLTNSNPVKLK